MEAGGGVRPAQLGMPAPAAATAAGAAPSTPPDPYKPLRDYLSSFEDGALAAGGLLATIAGSLGKGSDPSDGFVLVGLGIAAIGKALPSLYSDRKSVQQPQDPSHDPNSKQGRFWWLYPFGDSLLVIIAAISLIVYGLFSSYSLTDFLIIMGVAFMAKATVDIAHDFLLAYPLDKKPGIAPPGGPTEDLLFLAFGLAAVLLSIPGFQSGLGATPALGIAALGKALPSLLQSGSSAGNQGGGGGAGK